MIIYQADLFETVLPTPIDLIITSPPIKVLNNQIEELFKWFEKSLADDGVVVMDVPGLYNNHNRIVNSFSVASIENRGNCSLKLRFALALYKFYALTGVDSLYFYSRIEIEALKSINYRKCDEREMKHRCEYDSVLISNLVQNYTSKNETVLDPFCGTGTVPRVAHQLGRKGIGIDLRCPYTNAV